MVAYGSVCNAARSFTFSVPVWVFFRYSGFLSLFNNVEGAMAALNFP